MIRMLSTFLVSFMFCQVSHAAGYDEERLDFPFHYDFEIVGAHFAMKGKRSIPLKAVFFLKTPGSTDLFNAEILQRHFGPIPANAPLDERFFRPVEVTLYDLQRTVSRGGLITPDARNYEIVVKLLQEGIATDSGIFSFELPLNSLHATPGRPQKFRLKSQKNPNRFVEVVATAYEGF